MSEQLFEIVMTATGEVRDKDGNLISAEPIEGRMVVNAEQAAQIRATFNEGEKS